jgi:hypothetical protein
MEVADDCVHYGITCVELLELSVKGYQNCAVLFDFSV